MLRLWLGSVARGRKRIAPEPVNLDRPQFLRPCRDPRFLRTFPVTECRKRSECRQDTDRQDGHDPSEIE